MRDWNVIVSIYQEGFRHALRALRQFAPTEQSGHYNVLTMKADDPMALLAAIERKAEESTALYDPDAVIAIDTIDDRAGLALWTRVDLAQHRLLRPD